MRPVDVEVLEKRILDDKLVSHTDSLRLHRVTLLVEDITELIIVEVGYPV